MANPRYPHQCSVYRVTGATSFNPEGQKTKLYPAKGETGECRKSSSDNIRTFNTGLASTGKVDTTDYRISIPWIIEGVQKGDLVDVTDRLGTERGLRVVMTEYTELGEGGTALLCNTSSN